MASKRKIRRKKCEGKKRHETHESARNQKFSLIRKGIAIGEINIYKCEFCNGYHIGRSHRLGLN